MFFTKKIGSKRQHLWLLFGRCPFRISAGTRTILTSLTSVRPGKSQDCGTTLKQATTASSQILSGSPNGIIVSYQSILKTGTTDTVLLSNLPYSYRSVIFFVISDLAMGRSLIQEILWVVWYTEWSPNLCISNYLDRGGNCKTWSLQFRAYRFGVPDMFWCSDVTA
jgi:hypothetical protein